MKCCMHVEVEVEEDDIENGNKHDEHELPTGNVWWKSATKTS